MTQSSPKPFHYPRWPLIKRTTLFTAWLIAGLALFLLVSGILRWLGVAMLVVGLVAWKLNLWPQWTYVIRCEATSLKVGHESFDWKQFNRMQLERNGSARSFTLSGPDQKQPVVIKDDLPGFDALAQECFSYFNRKPEEETRPDQTTSGFNS